VLGNLGTVFALHQKNLSYPGWCVACDCRRARMATDRVATTTTTTTTTTTMTTTTI
jgi:hypothetical protein